MTGPEHYREAEQAASASVYGYQKWGERGAADDLKAAKWHQAQAQVHATLALAAATALNDGDPGMDAADWNEWRKVAHVKPEVTS